MIDEDGVLSVDIGGTEIKFGVMAAAGVPQSSGRAALRRPCSPESLLAQLDEIVPASQVKSVVLGVPARVTDGRITSASQFWREGGVENVALRDAWEDFDLATVASARWRVPTMVVNDAVLHGAGVTSGSGVELVLTLGTPTMWRGTTRCSTGPVC